MTDEFRRIWLHDESVGPRYLPVAARNIMATQELTASALIAPRVIDENLIVKFPAAARAFLDVSAGWAHLAHEIQRAVADPKLFVVMLGVDIGDISVASIGLGSSPRAVWSARAGTGEGDSIRQLMESLGWRAVNEHILASDAVYGELDMDSRRVPWTESVNAAIELAVLMVPDTQAVVRLFTYEDDDTLRQVGPDYSLLASTAGGEWPWMLHDATERSTRNNAMHDAWFSQMDSKMQLANQVLARVVLATGVDAADLMEGHLGRLPIRPPWLQHGDLFQKTAWWHLAAVLGRSMLPSGAFSQDEYDALTSLWRRFVGHVAADDVDILDAPDLHAPDAPQPASATLTVQFPEQKASADEAHIGVADADSIIALRQSDTFGQIFPHISPERALDSLRLSVRVHNRLLRDGATCFAELAPYTVGEVLAWSGVGVGSVRESLRSLLLAGIDLPMATTALVSNLPPDDEPAAAEWQSQALEDLELLARWHRLLGADDASLFSIPEGLNEPSAVVAARERLGQLAADRVLAAPSGNGLASELVEQLLMGLDERDLLILRRRVFAEKPATLDALGVELGITREYVRQREAKVKASLADLIASDELAGLANAIRAATTTDILPLRVLLQQYPSLAEVVSSVDVPMWRVLDRLDDSYEVRDGWVASPTLAKAVAHTNDRLKTWAGERAYVEIDAIDAMPASLTDEWLDYCGVKRLLGYVLISEAGITERAAVVLAAAEEPLAAVDIHARLGVERSLNAVKNSLAVDERFTRVGLDTWALKEWGLRGYQSIKKSIGHLVDASGEGVALEALIDAITSRVDVSSSSIVTYAAAHPFITQAGIVRRRTRREMRHPQRRKGLAQTRGLYRHGKSVMYRLTITNEHTRGSGTPLPNALGEELDLAQAEKRDLPVRGGGTVTLSWRGPQISIGSIRAEVQKLGLVVGDLAFLIFHADGSLEVTVVQLGTDDLGQVSALTGGPTSGDTIESLADRIDSDASSVSELAHAFTARGEHQLADLISRSVELSG